MTIVISTITACSSGGHIVVNGTVNGVAVVQQFVKSDFTDNPDPVDAFIIRVRSAIKEAGASTLNQIKTALEGKTFQV